MPGMKAPTRMCVSAGGRTRQLHRNVRCGKADLSGGEGVNQATQCLTLQIGGACWCRGEFAADDEVALQYVDDTLHLERLHEVGADLGVVEQFLADPLDGLAHRLDVGARLEMKVELHYRPIAAVIGDRQDLPERDRVHVTVLVTQPYRAQ